MRPTRRVLLAIGVLSLALISGTLVTWHLQTRALGEALMADIEALLARTITREPKPSAPKHDNGYACVARVLEVTPKDLSPFTVRNTDVFHGLMDGGVLSDEVQEQMTRLEPWAESLRSCGDSAGLQFVPGETPFAPWTDTRSTQGLLALQRLTRLELRSLATEGQWELSVERCAATLEVALDQSHLNLIGAMVAGSTVRQLTPPCAEALEHLDSAQRASRAPRFAALPARLAANHEFIETERLMMSLETHRWLLSDEQQLRAPTSNNAFDLENPASRFVLARSWRSWDRALRRLGETADVPGAARLEASLRLDGVFDFPWLPAALSGAPSYEKFFLRNEDTATLLQVLATLAAGDSTWPAQVARTGDGLEFTDSKGEKLSIPLR